MEQKKIGAMISSARTQKGFSKKELAEKLKVSESLVNKWENGSKAPQAHLIVPIAEMLELSVLELMAGKKEKYDEKEEEIAKKTINMTLAYSKGQVKKEFSYKENVAMGILTVLCILAISICLLCNEAISHTLSWSLIVAGGVGMLWIVIMPIMKFKTKGIWIGLGVLSIAVIPYLYLIEMQSNNKGWLMPLGMPVALMGIVFLWAIAGIFNLRRASVWNKLAVVCFLSGCLTLFINIITRNYCHQSWLTIDIFINVVVEVALAIILVIIGQATRNKESENETIIRKEQVDCLDTIEATKNEE